MTAQFSDSLHFEGTVWVIAGVAGTGLHQFVDDLPFAVVMTSTANWRGHYSRFALEEGRLGLKETTIGVPPEAMQAPGVPPPIFGTLPMRYQWRETEYAFDPPVHVPFSGGLLVGQRLLSQLYVHMGYHPAWKFDRVSELLFTEGRLQCAHERSQEMADVRARMRSIEPGEHTSPAEIREWVERCLALDYSLGPAN